MWLAFAAFHISHFSSKHISVYAVFDEQSFNETLTNDIVSFEQLGPEVRSTNHLDKWTLPKKSEKKNYTL